LSFIPFFFLVGTTLFVEVAVVISQGVPLGSVLGPFLSLVGMVKMGVLVVTVK
jgi:hypothetical protein